MGVNYNASATTDGLVFYVDAANPKSYNGAENLLMYSSSIGNSLAYTIAGGSIVLNAALAPDGTFTATEMDQLGQANNYIFGGASISLVPNKLYTYSIYFKQVNTNDFYLTIDEAGFAGRRYFFQYVYSTQTLTTGYSGAAGNGVITNAYVVSVGNGWFRGVITFRTSTSSVNFFIDMINRFSGANKTYVWGRQLERGDVVSNYLPTTATALPRSSTWIDMINGNNVTLVNGPGFANNTIQFRETSSGNNSYGVAQVDYGIMRQSGARSTWTLETVFTYLTQTSGNGNFGVIENVIFGRQGCHGGIYTWSPNLLYADIKTQDCWTGYSSAPFGSVVPGNTYHCVMTYNNGVTKTYLNGYYVGTGSMNVDIYYPVYGTALYLGGIPSYNPNIDMHVARAYTKELSTAEVLQNYNAFKGRGGM